MTSLSVKQKALVFLNKYKSLNSNDIYNTPWELTQDGVANALCISRAHASIVLNQLKDEGKTEEKITHIRNGKVKRKSYFITPAGMEEASRLLDIAAKDDIDLSFLLDSNKQGTNVNIEKLGDADRYALGCACAFNMPVKVDSLPPIVNFSLPTDVNGFVIIDDDLRNRVLAGANDEERAEWHGFAANYWFDKKIKVSNDYYECLHELLYHYVESGRNRDACKLISNDTYYLINSIDDELHDTVKKVRPVERYAKDVLMLSIEVCLEYDELDEADGLVRQLKDIDPDCASAYIFDIEMKKGNRDSAKAAIEGTWKTYPMAGIRWASLLREDGRYQEARDVLGSIKGIAGTDLDNFQLEKFIELSRIDCAEGHYEDAYQRLSKARATVKNSVYDKRFNALEKDIKSKLKL